MTALLTASLIGIRDGTHGHDEDAAIEWSLQAADADRAYPADFTHIMFERSAVFGIPTGPGAPGSDG